jgi:chromosome segregation ATPase
MEEQKEMSTKNKINNLINSIQNKLNKRVGNFQVNQRRNIDINTFQSFGPPGMPQDSTNQKNYKNNNYKSNHHSNPTYNNYINNPDLPQVNEPITFNEGYKPINEYFLRNIIKEEFNSLILPYQKDNLCNSNLMESKLNEIEKKFQIIINAQNMGELNDNAKIISAYLCSNLSNDNLNKNIEKFKMEYDNLLDGLQKKIDSLNNQLNTQKINYDSNISNIYKKIDFIDKKISENEHKEIKIYVEKNIFDEEIKKVKENQTKILDDNENNIINLNNDFENNKKDLKKQIDNLNNTLNQYISDINNNANKFNNINNNLNSLRTDFGKITEDVNQIKYQITPDLINKINSIDLNSLKQQISPNEFKTLKDNMNILETNLNSIKTMAENNDRSNYDLKKLINSVEEKQNLSNKNIENIQPLLNENILDKIKTINTKIEELSKIKPNDNDDNKEKKEEKKDEQNNREEKKRRRYWNIHRFKKATKK